MKRYPVLCAVVCLIGSVYLSGCSGMGSVAMPDTPDQVAPGAIHGSVFGGHAPIVGARVYVLETGQSGYASPALSKLTTGTASDAIGTYVLTDNTGSFNVTNDYSCDVGRPVYLAAAGGSPDSYPTFAISAIAATTVTAGTYNITFTGNNLLYVGQSVEFSGLSLDSFLNSATAKYVVTAATTTTFTISVTTGQTVSSGTATGTVAPQGVANPAIVNLAVLGLCPGTTGEFANTIHFVYMNEVATAAAAYALSGFATGPYAIGAPTTNLTGIQNAAVNAGQLYDIQGGNTSTTYDGEGHIARAVTPQLNGIVPQKTLDALGNILASCVDSGNTALSASATCTTLLNNATDSAGNAAANTAAAAFNIAHNPAGPPGVTSATWVNILYSLSLGTVPFTPTLTSQPNDFMVGIQYTPASEGATNAALDVGPQSIATDSAGRIWYTTAATAAQTSGYIVTKSAVGTKLYGSPLNSQYTYGNVTVDSSDNGWTGNFAGYFPPTEVVRGTSYTLNVLGVGSFTNGRAAVADATGDVYFVHGPTAGYPISPTCCALELTEVNAARNAANSSPSLQTSFGNNFVSHGAIDSLGYLWFTSESGNTISRVQASTANGSAYGGFPINTLTLTATCSGGAIYSPEQPAIDAAGAAWIPLYAGGPGSSVVRVVPSATGATACTTFSTGTGPYGAAVDGASNVWITNRGSNSLTELNSTTGASVPPGVNLTAGGLLSDPINIAVDISGDLFITNYTGNSLVEVIGGATPAYGPLGVAAGAGKLGAQP